MLNTGKCPNTDCRKTITKVQAENVEVMVGSKPAWVGLSLLCPHCKTVLGASIDPIALKIDIVKEITRGR